MRVRVGEGREEGIFLLSYCCTQLLSIVFPPTEELPSSSGDFERHQEPHSLPDFAQSTR